MAIRTITIDAVMNGFIVKVGCQTVVFESSQSLVYELKQYLDDPNETEKRWVADAINARHTYGPTVGQVPEHERQRGGLADLVRDTPPEEAGNTTGGANPWADTAQHTRDHMAMATGLPLAHFQPPATGGIGRERRYEELVQQRANLLNELQVNERNLNDL